MEKRNEENDVVVSVKLHGAALQQVIAERGKREKETGKIISIVGLVREAIGVWSEALDPEVVI